MSRNNINSHRARLAALYRWKGTSDPALHEARNALQEETFVAAVQRALKAAPPITPKLRARVLTLLAAAAKRGRQ